MRFFDNPITNPFYRTADDDAESFSDVDYDSVRSARPSHENEERADKEKRRSMIAVDAPPSGQAVEQGTTTEYEDGVQKAEAIAIVWSKLAVVMAYISIYLMFFVISLQAQVASALLPYVYSDFRLHSLVTLCPTMSAIIGGVFKIPTARLVDVWGRAQTLLLMVGFMTLGMILMATTSNVETYTTGQVFYWLGNDGAQYCLDVIISDTTSLGNRGLMLAFSTTPYIGTSFAGPAIAKHFIAADKIPWGFGVFCIIIPLIAMPLVGLQLTYQKKAERAGLYSDKKRTQRTVWGFIKYWSVKFDVGGIFILIAGMVLFLVPFQVATIQAGGWSSPTTITLIAVGFSLLVFFPFYEAYIATKPFIPWNLMKERTLLGACLAVFSVFIAFYCWDAYLTSFCQVVWGLDVQNAGYLSNIYSIGSPFIGVVVGALVHYSGRYKWLGLLAVPVYALGSGLMIHFRRPDQPIGYLVMCQIFIAFGGGAIIILEQIAALAVCTHGEIATGLAVVALAAQVGGAIGGAVSGAIWTNTFPVKLAEYLPAEDLPDIPKIVSSLPVQLSYPLGSATRDAIIHAYGDSQYRMCIASTTMMIVTLIGVWMWRDIQLHKRKQIKGRVIA